MRDKIKQKDTSVRTELLWKNWSWWVRDRNGWKEKVTMYEIVKKNWCCDWLRRTRYKHIFLLGCNSSYTYSKWFYYSRGQFLLNIMIFVDITKSAFLKYSSEMKTLLTFSDKYKFSVMTFEPTCQPSIHRLMMHVLADRTS